MEKRLYVGNLPYDMSEDQLHELFAVHGQVASTKLITDFNTGRSRGFGFVEMQTEEAAKSALEKMNRAKVGERELVVSEARPRPAQGEGDSRGGNRSGGGNSRGGNRGGRSGGGYGGGYSGGGNAYERGGNRY